MCRRGMWQRGFGMREGAALVFSCSAFGKPALPICTRCEANDFARQLHAANTSS